MAETFVTLALHAPARGKADTAFLGPEMGKEVMENYTETKSVAVKLG
jgi:hypothetical protein